MKVKLKSLRSSSSGNSIFLSTPNTKLLIDCGLSSMKKTRQILSQAVGDISEIDAVLISHTHSDHISYYPLRVLEQYQRKIYISENSLEQLEQKHFRNYGFNNLEINCYNGFGFTIGDLHIHPFKLKHQPDYQTHGFEIYYKAPKKFKKIVIATDFCDTASVAENFLDADMIFVESNHDLELLRQNFNPNSRYHLPNPQTAELLYQVYHKSEIKFQNIILGHMSKQRNEHRLALDEVINYFNSRKCEIDFNLLTAPADTEGRVLEI